MRAFSTSYTRWFLGSQVPPAVGQLLYSNHARKMFKVVEDRVKVHDMQYMACNPGLYATIDDLQAQLTHQGPGYNYNKE